MKMGYYDVGLIYVQGGAAAAVVVEGLIVVGDEGGLGRCARTSEMEKEDVSQGCVGYHY